MIIGVFDSGIGGEAVAKHLKKSFPEATILSVNDHNNVPYGTKSSEEIIRLTERALEPLFGSNCDFIVIACNTATAIAIEYLRRTHPDQTFVGLEPMIKPAASASKTHVIAVCATPATLRSARYKNLKQTYGANTTIIEPDCASWASLIEANRSDELQIQEIIHDLIEKNVDVIVLACTHYHWIKQRIIQAAGTDIIVLDPSEAITTRLRKLSTP